MSFDKARLQKIGPAMQRYIERGTYAGVSVLVAQRGEVAFEESWGFRDREAGTPMTLDTIFRHYSMTKPIVSTALMLLVEEARLRLVDPLEAYLPAFGKVKVLGPHGALVAPRRPIFVRDLLTHTSGLTYGFLADSPVGKDYARAKLLDPHVTLEEGIDELATMSLAYHPGERYHYSVGIDVAARVIEVVSGQSLGAFLRERLLDPLKMRDTDFVVPAAKRDRLAAMYGRPDIMAGIVQPEAIALWREGRNERIDVSATYLRRRAGHVRARRSRPVRHDGRLFPLRADAVRGRRARRRARHRPQDAGADARQPFAAHDAAPSRSAARRCWATASASARAFSSTPPPPACRARWASSAGRARPRRITGSIRANRSSLSS